MDDKLFSSLKNQVDRREKINKKLENDTNEEIQRLKYMIEKFSKSTTKNRRKTDPVVNPEATGGSTKGEDICIALHLLYPCCPWTVLKD